MDINRLNEFIVLATDLNYSKAANELFLTQPALSRHIHDLEETLGAQLFVRDTHKVCLTPIGELFFPEAQEILEKYNQAVQKVQEAASSISQQLNIGFLGAAVQPFLTMFLNEFEAAHPQIQTNLESSHLDPLIRMLEKDEIDICFVTHVDDKSIPGLHSETLMTDPMYVVLHPSHPLANREKLTLKDLSDVPFIGFDDENPYTNEIHAQLFKKASSNYNVVEKVPNVDTALFCVKMNLGAFIIPSHLQFLTDGLVVLPLEGENCFIHLNLLWKKSNPNPTIPIFYREFDRFFKEIDPHTGMKKTPEP